MKKILPSLILSGGLLFSLSSCDDAKEKVEEARKSAETFSDLSVDNLGENAAETMKDLPDILLSIKDEATLDEASTKLDTIESKLKALVAAASKLPKPAADKATHLADKLSDTVEGKWGGKMDEAEKHMGEFVKNNPDLAEKVGALKKKFKATTRPIKNIFDADGALGTPDE